LKDGLSKGGVVSVRVAYGHSCEYICSIGGVISMCGTFVLSVVNGDGCAVEVMGEPRVEKPVIRG